MINALKNRTAQARFSFFLPEQASANHQAGGKWLYAMYQVADHSDDGRLSSVDA